jgi:Tfp pilus assembly protein PilV
LKTKLKGCHFDAIEVIEVESQVVLNNLTGHNFQTAFKNGRHIGNSAYVWKGTTSRVMVACKPKVSFCPNGSTSSGNYGCPNNVGFGEHADFAGDSL